MSSTKAELIKEMIEVQHKFSKYEQENGVDPKDLYKPDSGSELDGYRDKYQALADKVIDLAHAETGSER